MEQNNLSEITEEFSKSSSVFFFAPKVLPKYIGYLIFF